jgi:transcription-repair coupling factor (superfamily II helicase)
MRDLDIRGAGNLLGAEQTGFISDLGFDTYHRILDDAIQELKETDFKDLFAEELSEKIKMIVQDCIIETDLEILIPETYINNTSERLQLYSRLDNIRDESEIGKFASSLVDRFGPLPDAVEQLINSVRLRWMGESLGFEKISLKNEKLRAHFISGKDEYFKSDVFGKILSFVKTHPQLCKMKELGSKLVLTIENITSVKTGIEVLTKMMDQYPSSVSKTPSV